MPAALKGYQLVDGSPLSLQVHESALQSQQA
jgi:hypothetical protein